jgi:hypothetical protein
MSGTYDHTQSGPLAALLSGLAAAFAVAALAAWSAVSLAILPLVALLLLLASGMARLRVRDAGRALVVRYGPLPLFGWSFPYADVSDVRASRSRWIDGFGIHWIPWRGWTLNLWGFDCVELRVRGKRYRIGTDDPEGLASWLRAKTAADDGAPVFHRRSAAR